MGAAKRCYECGAAANEMGLACDDCTHPEERGARPMTSDKDKRAINRIGEEWANDGKRGAAS